ncbi:MAG TPA: hypothetical protein VK627_06180 [Edaphobacter sp.]|nr:hypothetical protein [Edaphobacter sp.]
MSVRDEDECPGQFGTIAFGGVGERQRRTWDVEECEMRLLKVLRVVLVLNVLIMLIQSAFAGRLIGGGYQALVLHEFTAKVLVLLGCGQFVVAVFLRRSSGCPTWIPVASGALVAAEVLEFAAGHFHNVALHVPLGVAIFGGAIRQLIWSMREARVASELRA